MKRQEVLEILKDVPLKFRTSKGTVITIRKVLQINGEVLKFLDLKDKVAYISFEDITHL
jgi:hypothetical protein